MGKRLPDLSLAKTQGAAVKAAAAIQPVAKISGGLVNGFFIVTVGSGNLLDSMVLI
ncbi:MAG: hypothetical protein WDM76_13040 [Limisphaerales bacterium]